MTGIELIIQPEEWINLSTAALAEIALQRGEGKLASNGALVVQTGNRTGRSPKDRFIVQEASTDQEIDWGAINQPISSSRFDALWGRVRNYLASKETFMNDLHVGADANHYLPIRVTTEYAWHAMFARTLFVRPKTFNPADKDTWEIVSAPDFCCDPQRDGTNSDAVVIINFAARRVLLAGLRYAGEMKKSMFAVQNFLLPSCDVLPMHCSANISADGKITLFFGLSGTGKTTLSSDPECLLIGDDEHGWGQGTVFNLEGGCYAKCINLSREDEPIIYGAIRFGAIIENVVIDNDTREPDYTDSRYTENTRACYSRDNIREKADENKGGEPSSIIFLTCDVSGVLPPVAILSKKAAAYHFLSGYTAQVGSTIVGSTEAYSTTFSACFGAAFFPRPPSVYANLLMKRIEQFGSQVYLVNTGWTGGGYGVGRRFTIPETRTIVKAVRTTSLVGAPRYKLERLNLEIPTRLDGLEPSILDPRNAWPSESAYNEAADSLIAKFKANFATFDVDPMIVAAGPV